MENQFISHQQAVEIKKLAQTHTKQFENKPTNQNENQSEEKMPLADKITYAFCILSATYFIGRFIIGIIFNV
jgi:hypothetical protein